MFKKQSNKVDRSHKNKNKTNTNKVDNPKKKKKKETTKVVTKHLISPINQQNPT